MLSRRSQLADAKLARALTRSIARLLCIFIASAAPGILTYGAYGQAPTGVIFGRVSDPTGAVILHARIVITSRQAAERRSYFSNDTGDYSAPALLPGTYDVAVDAPGFALLSREVIVEAGVSTRSDFELPVSPAKEAITVIASLPQMRYDSHDVSNVVRRAEIQDLPLNGRNFLELAKLEPGVQQPSRGSNNRTFLPVLGSPTSGNGGARTRVTVDGGSVMQVGNGGAAMGFSQEVVEEFQLSSVNMDASAGPSASGAVNVVTRSGGNDLHGSGFLFFRDHTLAAYPGLKRDLFNRNPFFQRRQLGFAAGGPIRKDRLFFFAAFDRNEQRGVVATQLATPDFASFSRITPSPTYSNQLSLRFDLQLSPHNFLFLRQSHEDLFAYGPTTLGTPSRPGPGDRAYPSAWTRQPAWVDQSVLGITSQLNPQLTNELHFSYFFVSSSEQPPQPGNCAGCLGMGAPAINVFPDLFVGSSTSTRVLGRRFQFNDAMTLQQGAHRIAIGGNWQVDRGGGVARVDQPFTATLFSPQTVRNFNARNTQKQIPLPGSFLTFADILQLPVQIFSVGIGDPHIPQRPDFGKTRVETLVNLYAHDTWRIKPNVSINYGLAWSVDTPLNYDLRKPAYLIPILGTSGLGPTQKNWTDFSPSLGFAWSPGKSGTTVVRGGAGIYYDVKTSFGLTDLERNALLPRGAGQMDFLSTGIANPLSDVPGVPLGTLLNFQNPTLFTGAQLLRALDAIRASLAQQQGDPNNRDFSITNIEVNKQGAVALSHIPDTLSLQMSVGIQREIARDFVVTADFVVRDFRHYSTGPAGTGSDGNHFLSVRGPVLPVCAGAQRNDPHALCSLGPITVFSAFGRGTYRGLLLRADKRLSRRWQILGSYAYSSNVGTNFGNGFNNDNVLANRGPSDRDVRHILNLSGVVQLPKKFEMGWTMIYNSTPPFSAFLGGLDLNGDGTTGDLLPGTTVNQFNRSLGKTDLQRLVADFNRTHAGGRDAKGRPIPTIMLPANFAFGDHFLTHDMRLGRTFAFGERVRLTLMGEMFNVFNIANLSGRSGDLLSPSFGQATSRLTQVFGSGGPRTVQLAARVTF